MESSLFGGEQKYLDLTSIHVSEDMRGMGIGKALFLSAKEWAKNMGAGKLYISAHSPKESIAAYKSYGCVPAEEVNEELAEKEPCDLQLEYALG